MGNRTWEGKPLDTPEGPEASGIAKSQTSNPDSFPAGVVLGCVLGIGLTLIVMAVLGTVSMVCGR